MKVWVIRNKRKEFRYFDECPKMAGPNEVRGHYVRTDIWPSDIECDMQTHKFVSDEPPIPVGTWFVRKPSGEVDYGKRLPIINVPPIRRKIMTFRSDPIQLDVNPYQL